MSVTHKNFYETLKEALMRLKDTVVLYDGLPYIVGAITDHKPDGIYRVYLLPIDGDKGQAYPDGLYDLMQNYPQDYPTLGTELDKWMTNNPNVEVLRKHINSPLFNRFRPFPLGMCNVGKNCYYVERQPNRKSEQGLIASMMYQTLVSTANDLMKRTSASVNITSKPFRDCILGEYPTAMDVLINLQDPEVENNAVGFHRQFALVRGPMDMLFLAYKTDVVGMLTQGDFSQIKIGREFIHTKEVIEGLGLFSDIIM